MVLQKVAAAVAVAALSVCSTDALITNPLPLAAAATRGLPACSRAASSNYNNAARSSGQFSGTARGQCNMVFSFSQTLHNSKSRRQERKAAYNRMHVAHDEVTFRDRAGMPLSVPQAERYSSRDWLHNILTLPSSIILNRIKAPVMWQMLWATLMVLVNMFHTFTLSMKPLTLLGSSLGLLLVFRLVLAVCLIYIVLSAMQLIVLSTALMLAS
jgi:hypothetical protein